MKNKKGRLILPIIKSHCGAIVIKTMWYWQRHRHIDQWNNIANPHIIPQKYAQLNFTKR